MVHRRSIFTRQAPESPDVIAKVIDVIDIPFLGSMPPAVLIRAFCVFCHPKLGDIFIAMYPPDLTFSLRKEEVRTNIKTLSLEINIRK